MKEIVIQTDKLCKSFSSGGRQQHVLKNLDLSIYKGDFTVIMGASGSGKSTLLYALSGMDKPTLGEVMYGDVKINHLGISDMAVFRRKNCGFVFQQIHLLDNMSVLDNVLACGLLVSRDKKAVAARAKELLGEVGIMKEDWGKFPSQLSGGMQQRTAIARALAYEPSFIMMDEPFAALDYFTREQMQKELLRVQGKQGSSILFVTHSIDEALLLGHRIVVIENGLVKAQYQVPKTAGERNLLDDWFISLKRDIINSLNITE